MQKLRIKNGFQREAFEHLAVWKLKTETALIIDAVHLLHETLKELHVSPKLDVGPLYCNNSDSWEKGSSIINYMKAVNSIMYLLAFFLQKHISYRKL